MPKEETGGERSRLELGAFLARFPVDRWARERLRRCSAGVQAKVLKGFVPRSEGEADYSALVMAYLTKVKGGKDGVTSYGKLTEAKRHREQEWAAQGRWKPSWRRK